MAAPRWLSPMSSALLSAREEPHRQCRPPLQRVHDRRSRANCVSVRTNCSAKSAGSPNDSASIIAAASSSLSEPSRSRAQLGPAALTCKVRRGSPSSGNKANFRDAQNLAPETGTERRRRICSRCRRVLSAHPSSGSAGLGDHQRSDELPNDLSAFADPASKPVPFNKGPRQTAPGRSGRCPALRRRCAQRRSFRMAVRADCTRPAARVTAPFGKVNYHLPVRMRRRQSRQPTSLRQYEQPTDTRKEHTAVGTESNARVAVAKT